jgi:5S rRNA maturation endonuclease (ribonuclease M5)
MSSVSLLISPNDQPVATTEPQREASLQQFKGMWPTKVLQLPSGIFVKGKLSITSAAATTLAALHLQYKQRKAQRPILDDDGDPIPTDKTAIVWIRRERLMELTGLCLRSVATAIRTLHEAKFIRAVVRDKGGPDGGSIIGGYELWGARKDAPPGPLAYPGKGTNVLLGNGVTYFNVPIEVVEMTDKHFSLAAMEGSEVKLYLAAAWWAATRKATPLELATRKDLVFNTRTARLRPASSLAVPAYRKAMLGLQAKGLIYMSIGDSATENALTLCDPKTGEPYHASDKLSDWEEDDPANYSTVSKGGRSRRVVLNGTPEQMRALLRQSVPASDPFIGRPDGEVMILCPFHGEQTPSCSVSPRGFWHCFGCGRRGTLSKLIAELTECSPAEVIHKTAAATGQTVVYRPPDSKATIYPYFDLYGLKKQVLRYDDYADGRKHIAQRRPVPGGGDWSYDTKGVPPLLYNFPLIGGNDVVIVEGERDAATVTSALPLDLRRDFYDTRLLVGVTSGGAQSWHPSLVKFLHGANSITVATDDDEQGRKFAEEIMASLDDARIEYRLVTFAGIDGVKDASDFVDKFGPNALGWFLMPELGPPMIGPKYMPWLADDYVRRGDLIDAEITI